MLNSYCIPTILIIQMQSSILLQSQCNYSTNVPEYIELGGADRHVRRPIAMRLQDCTKSVTLDTLCSILYTPAAII